MAKKLVPSEFKTHLIDQIVESVTEPANTVYYAFVGNHMTDASTIEEIDEPLEKLKNLSIDTYRNMIFGKKITSNDVKIMIKRNDWVANTVYQMYDDEVEDLYDKNFHVVVDENSFKHVYKCLYNAGGKVSTSKPLFQDAKYDAALFQEGDNYYETADGYQWKYMYSIPSTTFTKFATQNYIPVVANTTVSNNATEGSIDVVKVDTGGRNYNNFVRAQFNNSDIGARGTSDELRLPAGSSTVQDFYANTIMYLTSGTGAGQYRKIKSSEDPSSNGQVFVTLDQDGDDDIYGLFNPSPDGTTTYEIMPECRIIGDGTETVTAYARAIIDEASTNSVSKIEMLDVGRDYNFATAEILQGVVGSSANNFLSVGEKTAPTPATVRPMISPQGGHGTNSAIELGGRFLSMYMKFERDEGDTIPTENSFSQFGIIRDPLFSNVEIGTTTSANTSQAGADGTFAANETFVQFEKLKLQGSFTVVDGNTALVQEANGSFDYSAFLKDSDYIFIKSDTSVTYNHLSKVAISGSNNTSIELQTAPSFTLTPGTTTSNTTAYLARVISTGKIKQVSNTSSFYANKVDPSLVPGELIYGQTSKSVANVASININSRIQANTAQYNFGSYRQVTTILGTLADPNTPFEADEEVYQTNKDFTAKVFSANNTHLLVTNVSGTLDTSVDIIGRNNGAVLQSTVGNTLDKYNGDLDPTEGNIIYLQNDVPVTRNQNQTEEIRVILEF